MYYTGRSQSTGIESAQAGLGWVPMVAALAPLIPLAASLFAKKPKRPRGPSGPTKEEIAIAQEIERRNQADAARARRNKMLLIGGGVLTAGVAGYLLLRKRK